MMYPLKMEPVFKELIWGGDKLEKLYNKNVTSQSIGESWEVSCHKNGMSTIANGEFEGKTLLEIANEYPNEILGSLGTERNRPEKFPLLVKLIDAKENLSVQVHPNDEYAGTHENGELGKTEMWYILDAEVGSKLVYGVKNGINKEIFKHQMKNGNVEDCLNYVEVNAGDIFFIPAGTIHAIGSGIIIAEIQQNSDTTYRVYDYNRTGVDGKPRELHIQKALDVSCFDSMEGNETTKTIRCEKDTGYEESTFVECEYFSFSRIAVKTEYKTVLDGQTFHVIIAAKGEGTIEYNGGNIGFKKGDTFLMPACLGEYKISGDSLILKAWL